MSFTGEDYAAGEAACAPDDDEHDGGGWLDDPADAGAAQTRKLVRQDAMLRVVRRGRLHSSLRSSYQTLDAAEREAANSAARSAADEWLASKVDDQAPAGVEPTDSTALDIEPPPTRVAMRGARTTLAPTSPPAERAGGDQTVPSAS